MRFQVFLFNNLDLVIIILIITKSRLNIFAVFVVLPKDKSVLKVREFRIYDIFSDIMNGLKNRVF